VNWNAPEILAIIRSAIREDDARTDTTTHLMIQPSWRVEASVVAKQAGVVAGLPLAQKILKTLDTSIRFKPIISEGASVRSGQRIAIIRGKAGSVLSGERPMLNALQHLSGIATFAHAQVKKLSGTRVKLYDTRKTLPGWRLLQKYAVRCGGAENHRMSLGDEVMIKENHLKIARLVGSDWFNRVRQSMKKRPSLLIQMEIQTEQDLQDALRLKPPRVLLDNLSNQTLKRMMRILRKAIPDIQIELTGGVRPETLRSLAKLGPDRISMGRLTHSVPVFDCSLDITRVYPR